MDSSRDVIDFDLANASTDEDIADVDTTRVLENGVSKNNYVPLRVSTEMSQNSHIDSLVRSSIETYLAQFSLNERIIRLEERVFEGELNEESVGAVGGRNNIGNFINFTNKTEPLNNQVPPRMRANNYWDNFKSNSHQNFIPGLVSKNIRPLHSILPTAHNNILSTGNDETASASSASRPTYAKKRNKGQRLSTQDQFPTSSSNSYRGGSEKMFRFSGSDEGESMNEILHNIRSFLYLYSNRPNVVQLLFEQIDTLKSRHLPSSSRTRDGARLVENDNIGPRTLVLSPTARSNEVLRASSDEDD